MKHGSQPASSEHVEAEAATADDRFGGLSLDDIRKINDSTGKRTQVRNNPDIPAGYTYLAQFVAHDLGFHSFSGRSGGAGQDPENFACKPHLDLSSLYGDGPEASPHLYRAEPGNASRLRLRLGESRAGGPGDARIVPIGTAAWPETIYRYHPPRGYENDLPRCPMHLQEKGKADEYDGTALIADPRNDEQMIISQLTVLFCRLHNAICGKLKGQVPRGEDVFAVARRMTVHCYHEVVLHDLLARLLDRDVLGRIVGHLKDDRGSEGGLTMAGTRAMIRDGADVPPEFWTAAFRFGHSMIQNQYNYNDVHPKALVVNELVSLMETRKGDGPPITDDWVIDWDRFFFAPQDDPEADALLAAEGSVPRNYSHPIGLSFAGQLSHPFPRRFRDRRLQIDGVAALDMARMAVSQAFAQSFARQLRGEVEAGLLDDSDLCAAFGRLGLDAAVLRRIVENTPIFLYVLAEAETRHGGRRLGLLGSTIVGEVVLAAIRLCRDPQAAADWQTYCSMPAPSSMPKVVKFVDASPAT